LPGLPQRPPAPGAATPRAKLIFYSWKIQATEIASKSELRRCRGTTLQNITVDKAFATCRRVGGGARPRVTAANEASDGRPELSSRSNFQISLRKYIAET